MQAKNVIVLPYDPQWKKDFVDIKQELVNVIGDLVVCIEHVGSTSVEGLSAKPVIDIDVLLPDKALFLTVAERLASIGYHHVGDQGIPDREVFKYENKPHLRKHHLYVCPPQSAEYHRHITFRDYLRSHPEAALEYGNVKTEGARRFPNDMDGYMKFKAPTVEKIYRECGLI